MRDALRRTMREPDDGFTLVEVVVACVILGILAAAVLGVLLQTQSQSITNRSRIAASNLAAREIDLVRDEFHRKKTAPLAIAGAGTVVNPHPLDGQTAGQPLLLDGKPYTVTRSVRWNLSKTGQSACDGGGLLVYPTLNVNVSVTWPNMGSVQPVVSSEALAPDKGSGIPITDSFIAVKVSDQDGRPSVGRSVRVQGGGQTKTEPTDDSGCAVVEMTPAAGAGTSYTAQVMDADYVDISSTSNPTKSVGVVSQGQLNNNVVFQVAKSGKAFIHLIDSNGNPILTPPAGAQVTLDAAEYSGSASGTPYAAAGAVTEVDNLWPTNYGAYYGTTPPDSSFERKDLAPGGTIDLNAILELANTSLTDLPAGAVVQVVAGAAATCSGAATVGTANGSDPLPVSLPPGEWTFFVSLPTASCSRGPDVTLLAGPNGSISWAFSTLTVTGAPVGATVYAAEASKVTSSASCPPTTQPGAALVVPAGGVELPAGTWYVWAQSGASCAKPSLQPSVVITAGQNYGLAWGSHSITLSITGIEAVATGSPTTRPHVYLSSTNVVGSGGLSCSASNVTSTTATVVNAGTPSQTGGTLTVSVGEGVWYVVGNDTRTSGSGRWSPTCRFAGKVTVGPYSGNLSINYTAVQSGTGYSSVGP